MREIFAQRLKELRQEKGISQVALGHELDLDQKFISLLEAAQRFVSVETLVLIANFFNVSTDYLLGRSDLK